MNYYAKPVSQDKKEVLNYKKRCVEQWANYKPSWRWCARIKYKHLTVWIQIKNYAHVLPTLSVSYYMDQVPQHILPQTEEVQEHYLQGNRSSTTR